MDYKEFAWSRIRSGSSANLDVGVRLSGVRIASEATFILTGVVRYANHDFMDEKSICENIRTLRLNRNMTLDELSSLTGLSKGYLSRVERSGKLPPFSTLNRVAAALGVEAVSLFTGDPQPPTDTRIAFVRKNERKVIVTRGSLYGYKYETLAHSKPGKSMEPYIIEPGFEEKALFQHEGEELLYVLEGTHEFTYDGTKYIMHEGDCVYFDSSVPHTGRSLGREKARLLAVMYPRGKVDREPEVS